LVCQGRGEAAAVTVATAAASLARSTVVPAVARDVGNHTEILLDTGIMSGADIVAAVALGARCTLIGRTYLYGLMAGGQAGVHRAIEILSGQLTRTMRLLGVTCLEELTPKHVTQLRRLIPVEPPPRSG
jgi:L-lactate dehydrogenase (cytochrome)